MTRPTDRRPRSAPSMTQTDPMPEYARLQEVEAPPPDPEPWKGAPAAPHPKRRS